MVAKQKMKTDNNAQWKKTEKRNIFPDVRFDEDAEDWKNEHTKESVSMNLLTRSHVIVTQTEMVYVMRLIHGRLIGKIDKLQSIFFLFFSSKWVLTRNLQKLLVICITQQCVSFIHFWSKCYPNVKILRKNRDFSITIIGNRWLYAINHIARNNFVSLVP